MVPAVLLLAMAAVVLLIAALNVANMMLARGAARRKEIAIRLALGGGRRCIVQQLLLEGLVLAILGGTAGLFLSYGGTTLLVRSMARLAPVDMSFQAGPDVRVLAATLGFCLLATLIFGFGPAWNLSRPNLVTDLKSSENAGSFFGKGRRLFSRRNLLVIVQVSLSLVLLTAAGLFIRSSSEASQFDPGFRLPGRLVVEMDPSLAGYSEVQGRQLYGALIDRVRNLPGVESASLAAHRSVRHDLQWPEHRTGRRRGTDRLRRQTAELRFQHCGSGLFPEPRDPAAARTVLPANRRRTHRAADRHPRQSSRGPALAGRQPRRPSYSHDDR